MQLSASSSAVNAGRDIDVFTCHPLKLMMSTFRYLYGSSNKASFITGFIGLSAATVYCIRIIRVKVHALTP